MALNELFYAGSPERPQPAPAGWWGSGWLWAALALASVVPFLVTSLPPIGDLYNHIGRYHVMLHHGQSAWLQKYYQFHWGILPNMGQDLLIVPFARVFGVERGAIILTALIPPAMVLGFRALSKTVHGRVEPVALLALPFSWSLTFMYGFLNYHTGVVVLVWTLVLWRRSIGWRPLVRYASLALLATAAWFCHLAAWGLVVVAVGAFELAAAFDRSGGRLIAELPGLAARVAPVVAPILLLLVSVHAASAGPLLNYHNYLRKLNFLAFPLRDQWAPLDVASLAVIGLVPVVLAVRGELKLQIGLSLFAVLVFALFWILPTALATGFYADLRLLSVVWFAALLACQVTAPARLQTLVALVAIALFAVRIGFTSHGWYERGRDLNTELEALQLMPQGARVAAMAPQRLCKTWADDGDTHIASLAIVRRDAFVNSEWDNPGQQLMQPDYLPGSEYNAETSIRVPGTTCLGKPIDELVAGLPRDRFDYVWIFKAQPPAGTSAWLKPVFRGPRGVLFSVAH
jgi:hypothetical protein